VDRLPCAVRRALDACAWPFWTAVLAAAGSSRPGSDVPVRRTGGFGTMDELFEAVTLVETGKITRFPIVLVGSSYWSGLLAWIRERVLAEGKISPGDLDLLTVADDPAEVVRIIAGEHGQAATEPPHLGDNGS
jgi:predicted Rossmann-fold nucleotide-binding protein